jgi:hypothetical protein
MMQAPWGFAILTGAYILARGNCGGSNNDSQLAFVADCYAHMHDKPRRGSTRSGFSKLRNDVQNLSNRIRFPNTPDVATDHVFFHTVVRP